MTRHPPTPRLLVRLLVAVLLVVIAAAATAMSGEATSGVASDPGLASAAAVHREPAAGGAVERAPAIVRRAAAPVGGGDRGGGDRGDGVVPADSAGRVGAPVVGSIGVSSARVEDRVLPEVTAPVRLVVDRIGIDAPIVPVGIDTSTRAMEVVDNVREVGWYRFGPSPGDRGSAVLAAHVDLAGHGPGVFFDLVDLEEGDGLTIDFADGSSRDFRVTGIAVALKSEVDLDEIFSRSGDPTVMLVTCGGGFDRDERHYDSNVVVTAAPVDDGAPVTGDGTAAGQLEGSER